MRKVFVEAQNSEKKAVLHTFTYFVGSWKGPSDTSLRDAIRNHPSMRGSVGQVVDKGYLGELVDNDPEISAVIHFDRAAEQITVEDPQFIFFIRNIPWKGFAAELGFMGVEFKNRYDFALSFGGEDRELTGELFTELEAAEVEVFYDKNERRRMLASDIEECLRPIYQSEAQFVIALLSASYPTKIWTTVRKAA